MGAASLPLFANFIIDRDVLFKETLLMLKEIDPLLGPELLRVLRAMGHGDEIAIVDGNYPAETDARRLIRMDGHDAPRLARRHPVGDAGRRHGGRGGVAARRLSAIPSAWSRCSSDFTAVLLKHEPKRKIVPLTGEDFYNRVKAASPSSPRAKGGSMAISSFIEGRDRSGSEWRITCS